MRRRAWSEASSLARKAKAGTPAEAVALLTNLAKGGKCDALLRVYSMAGPCPFNDPEQPQLVGRLGDAVEKCKLSDVDALRSSTERWFYRQHLAAAEAGEGHLQDDVLIMSMATRGALDDVVEASEEALAGHAGLKMLAKKLGSEPDEFDIHDLEKATEQLNEAGFRQGSGKRPLPAIALHLLTMIVRKTDSDLLSLTQTWRLQAEKVATRCAAGIADANVRASEFSWALLAQLSRGELERALLPCCGLEGAAAGDDAVFGRCLELHATVRAGVRALAGTVAGGELFRELGARLNMVRPASDHKSAPFFRLLATAEKCTELRATLGEVATREIAQMLVNRGRADDAPSPEVMAAKMLGYTVDGTAEVMATEKPGTFVRHPVFMAARFMNHVQTSYKSGVASARALHDAAIADGLAVRLSATSTDMFDMRRKTETAQGALLAKMDDMGAVEVTKKPAGMGWSIRSMERTAATEEMAARLKRVSRPANFKYAHRVRVLKQVTAFRSALRAVHPRLLDGVQAVDHKILAIYRAGADEASRLYKAFVEWAASLAPAKLRSVVRWTGKMFGHGPSVFAYVGRVLSSYDNLATMVDIFKDVRALFDAIKQLGSATANGAAEVSKAKWNAAATRGDAVAARAAARQHPGAGSRPLQRAAAWVRGLKGNQRAMRIARVTGRVFAVAGSAVGVVFDAADAVSLYRKGATGGAAVKGVAVLLGVGAMVAFWVGTGGIGFVLTVIALIASSLADIVVGDEFFAARDKLAASIGFDAGAYPYESLQFVEGHECARIARLGLEPAQAVFANLAAADESKYLGFIPANSYTFLERRERAIVKMLRCLRDEKRCDVVDAIMERHSVRKALGEVDFDEDKAMRRVLFDCDVVDVESYHMGMSGADNWVNAYIEQLKDKTHLAKLSEKKQATIYTALVTGAVYQGDEESLMLLLRTMVAAGQCDRVDRIVSKLGPDHAHWKIDGKEDAELARILKKCNVIQGDGWHGLGGDQTANAWLEGKTKAEIVALSDDKLMTMYDNLITGATVGQDEYSALKILEALADSQQCARVEKLLKKRGAAHSLWHLDGKEDDRLRKVMETCKVVAVDGLWGDNFAREFVMADGRKESELSGLPEEKQLALYTQMVHGYVGDEDGAAITRLLRVMKAAGQCERINRMIHAKGNSAAQAMFNLGGVWEERFEKTMLACGVVMDNGGHYADDFANKFLKGKTAADIVRLPYRKLKMLYDSLTTGVVVGDDERNALKILEALANAPGKCAVAEKLLKIRGGAHALFHMDGKEDDRLRKVMEKCKFVDVTGFFGDDFAREFVMADGRKESELSGLPEKKQMTLFTQMSHGYVGDADGAAITRLLRVMKAAGQCERIGRLVKENGAAGTHFRLGGVWEEKFRTTMIECDIMFGKGSALYADNYAVKYISHWHKENARHLADLPLWKQKALWRALITGFTVGEDEGAVLNLLRALKAQGKCSVIHELLKLFGGNHALWKLDGDADASLRRIMYSCAFIDVTGYVFNLASDDWARSLISYLAKHDPDRLARLPVSKHVRLVKKMIAGWTGGADEAAIIKLFRVLKNRKKCSELRQVLDKVGRSTLDGNVNFGSNSAMRGVLIACGVAIDDEDVIKIISRSTDLEDLGSLSVKTHARYFRHLFKAYTWDAEENAVLKLLRAINAKHGHRSAHLRYVLAQKDTSYAKFFDNLHGSQWTTAEKLLPPARSCYWHRGGWWVKTSGTCERTTWGTCSSDGECKKVKCSHTCKCGTSGANECFCVRKLRKETGYVCHGKGGL